MNFLFYRVSAQGSWSNSSAISCHWKRSWRSSSNNRWT